MLSEGVKAAKLKFKFFKRDNIYDLVNEVAEWLEHMDIKVFDISFLQDQEGSVAAVITFSL